MRKMILVLDAPSACISCPLFNASGKCCGYWQHAADEEDIFEKRPDWCPLKELPKKKGTSAAAAIHLSYETNQSADLCLRYNIGFNDCLDAIIGQED